MSEPTQENAAFRGSESLGEARCACGRDAKNCVWPVCPIPPEKPPNLALAVFKDNARRPTPPDHRDASAAFSYDPPVNQRDPRVCGSCRRSWGSALVPPSPYHFSIANSETGKYHSSRGYGVTDCGLDATKDKYVWPI